MTTLNEVEKLNLKIKEYRMIIESMLMADENFSMPNEIISLYECRKYKAEVTKMARESIDKGFKYVQS